MRLKTIILLILTVITLIGGIGIAYGQSNKEIFNNILILYQTNGIVMNYNQYGKYHVNPYTWNNIMNAKQKEDIAYQFACHNEYVNGNKKWAKIYDGMSGKLIAEWGVWGFKVY